MFILSPSSNIVHLIKFSLSVCLTPFHKIRGAVERQPQLLTRIHISYLYYNKMEWTKSEERKNTHLFILHYYNYHYHFIAGKSRILHTFVCFIAGCTVLVEITLRSRLIRNEMGEKNWTTQNRMGSRVEEGQRLSVDEASYARHR